MRAARDYIQSHRQRLSGASAPAAAPAVSRATATRRIKA
jgi:hypothetical protein